MVIEHTLSTLETAAAETTAEAQKVVETRINEEITRAKTFSSSLPEIKTTIVSILLFLPGFLFYKADLPSQASWGTVVKSRLLLLVLDGVIVYGFLIALRFRVPLHKAPVLNTFLLLLGPCVLALFYIHTTYIGPLHFWPQALQFIINVRRSLRYLRPSSFPNS